MFEYFPNIKALNFFDLKIDLMKYASREKLFSKKYLLPSFSKLLDEKEFAKVYMAYSEKGLYFIFDIAYPFTKVYFPDYKRADSVEIFIDTRSLKTKGYITKFCHHFVFFAEDIKKHKAHEITKFKADDMHKLCLSEDLLVKSIIKPKSYLLDIFIPGFCLYGYNLQEIDTISFTYRINRYQMPSQDFGLSSREHVIETSAHLWPVLALK
jgi:hypothetical protein